MEIHNRLIRGFEADSRCTGFKEYRGVNVTNEKELAGYLYRFFDVHYYKALDVIYQYETLNPGPITSVIQQEKITVVDLGAGIGTFSLALIDFVFQNKGARVQELNVVLVEPNKLFHELASWFFGEIEKKTGIKIHLDTVAHYFPTKDCFEQIMKKIEKMPQDFLIIGMSNLLHWVGNHCREQADFILNLVQKVQPLYAVLLSVESKDNFFRMLSFSMKKLYYEFLIYRKNNLCSCIGPQKTVIVYKNFPSSFYGFHKQPYRNEYLYGITIFNSGLSAMGSLENLRTAYFKSRMALRRQFPCDEIAIKLFESRLDSGLKSCARALKQEYKFCIKPVYYKAPKSSKEFRPLMMDNVYDSLVATAFLDLYGRRVDNSFLSVSCGNRINPRRKSEYIYQHFWYAWHNRFIIPIITGTPRKYKYYCHLDIASFYPTINQGILLNKIQRLLPSQDLRLRSLVQSLICRDYPDHKRGCGIPQGPVASGFLANLYLHEIDEMMDKRQDLVYRRYVDDIYLLSESQEALQKHVSELEEYLQNRLGLQLKKEKTENGTKSELYNRYSDPALDLLDKRLKAALCKLYTVNKEYLRVYETDQKEFLFWYSSCLRELGVRMSPEWLHRKIRYQRRRFQFLRALGIFLFRRRVSMPSLAGGLPSPVRWAEEFRRYNPNFCMSLEELREEIEKGLKDLYNQYKDIRELTGPEKNKVRSRFRFYTYRASILIAPKIEKILQDLVLRPWLCSIAVLRAYPHVLTQIARNFQNLFPYMRSAVLWAIGEIQDTKFWDFLIEVLFNKKSSFVVKLMASQALLKIGASGGSLDCRQLEEEIRMALDKPILLKNLILLWGVFCKDINRSELLEEVRSRCANFPEHERWPVEYALEGINEVNKIVSSLDIMPAWLEPEDYPDYEDIPEIVPMS